MTAQRIENPDVQVWSEELKTDTVRQPFLVGGGGAVVADSDRFMSGGGGNEDATGVELYSLVDAEMSLRYRIKPDGLLDYLNFASDQRRRRQRLSLRQNALKALALRTITQHLSELKLDEVIATGRRELIDSLRDRIQETYDGMRAGTEVVALDVLMLRPSGDVAKYWDDYATAKAQRRAAIAEAEQRVPVSLAAYVGDPEQAPLILAAIDEWKRLNQQLGSDDPAAIEQRLAVEQMIIRSGGDLANDLEAARAELWIKLMEARADVFRHQGHLDAYLASPRLYKQREVMTVLSVMLDNRRKYVFVGVDPERVNLSIKLEDTPSMFNFGDALNSDGDSSQ